MKVSARSSTPRDFSQKSWKRVLIETKNAFGNKNVGMLAAGIAYGGTLAFFPLVVASVAIAGTIISPETIKHVVELMAQYLPKDVSSLVSAQLINAMGKESSNVLVAAVAVLLALFGVSGAMSNLITALNQMYECPESRNIFKARLISLGLTSVLVVGSILTLPLILLGGSLLRSWGVPEGLVMVFNILRWPLLGLVMAISLSFVYRFAPNRDRGNWQWISWGSIIATLLWVAVTALFFIYVQYFAHFSDSYSLFAGIIVLMIWLNFSGMAILVGAEVNHQLETTARRP